MWPFESYGMQQPLTPVQRQRVKEWISSPQGIVWMEFVEMLARAPHMWLGGVGGHHGERAIFVLENMQDTRRVAIRGRGGGGLFPEIMKSDYHAIRSTIEAFIRTALVPDGPGPHVCGVQVGAGQMTSVTVRVIPTSGTTTASYVIDRWN